VEEDERPRPMLQSVGLEPERHEAVNQAYKDLAFIWHPDRIPKDNSSATESAREIEGD